MTTIEQRCALCGNRYPREEEPTQESKQPEEGHRAPFVCAACRCTAGDRVAMRYAGGGMYSHVSGRKILG